MKELTDPNVRIPTNKNSATINTTGNKTDKDVREYELATGAPQKPPLQTQEKNEEKVAERSRDNDVPGHVEETHDRQGPHAGAHEAEQELDQRRTGQCTQRPARPRPLPSPAWQHPAEPRTAFGPHRMGAGIQRGLGPQR